MPSNLLDETSEGELAKCITKWQILPVEIHIFDFKNILKMTKGCYPLITNFSVQLKKVNKTLISINLPIELKNDIVNRGLKDAFKPIDNTKDLRLIISKAKNRA